MCNNSSTQFRSIKPVAGDAHAVSAHVARALEDQNPRPERSIG